MQDLVRVFCPHKIIMPLMSPPILLMRGNVNSPNSGTKVEFSKSKTSVICVPKPPTNKNALPMKCLKCGNISNLLTYLIGGKT